MTYLCYDCLHSFCVPETHEESFRHAFGVSVRRRRVCPHCGSDDFSRAAPCPLCGGDMRHIDRLCAPCRRDLLARLDRFFTALHPLEREQFEDWMDGSSVEERKTWS